jgi:DNA-binding LytR/AlgR family response regulator
MQKIWQQPFPSPQNSSSIKMSFIAGICVFGVLYFFQPFGINQLASNEVFFLSIQYALVTILFSLLCNTGLPFLFPKFFTDVRWTVLHEIIFLLLLILIVAFGNILFAAFQSNTTISATLILKMLKYTLAIGIIPIVISVLIKQQQLLMKYSKGATEMEAFITEKNTQHNVVDIEEIIKVLPQKEESLINNLPPLILQLSGTNQQEVLNMAASSFLFAEASDNYTSIHYTENDVLQKVLYRITIKNLETQTVLANGIFRCHKSYLVNLNQVTHITGNAQGYKLHLLQNKFEIPVSRSLNSNIKEKFAALKAAN